MLTKGGGALCAGSARALLVFGPVVLLWHLALLFLGSFLQRMHCELLECLQHEWPTMEEA